MMFHPRLTAILTVLTALCAAGASRAELSLEQLQKIESMVSSKNCAGLWVYLHSNPELTAGDDPLAQELRKFASGSNKGVLNCLDLGAGSVPSPTQPPAPPQLS